MLKSKYTGLIIAITLLVGVSAVFGNVNLLKPVSTSITNLTWTLDSEPLNEDYTYFDFTIDYQIYNPNKNPITYSLAYCNLAFLTNISVTFENESLEYIPPHYIGLCLIGNKTIDPGITEETGYCFLTIKEKGLTDLPNGVYSIWVYLDGHPEVVANITTVTIMDDYTNISYNTSQTLGLDIPFSMIVVIASIILVTIKLKIKREEN